MAAVADKSGEAAAAAAAAANNNNMVVETAKSESKEFNVQKLVDMFTKLNPLAKEFFPSSYHHNQTKNGDFNQIPVNKQGNENYSDRRRRNNYNQCRRKFKAFRAQRDNSVSRTVYVSDIDQTVVDCRVCGDPHSVLRFAFVEFADEEGARAALNLGGTRLGFYPVTVLPSKTAILPVNPKFLPRSEDEREMCFRTVYCTNIDKKVSQADVKNFFESACGEVTHLRLLGDHVHSTRIAFVEFAMAESAIIALNCSGTALGTQPVRVSPSKTPVRPQVPR
ncbi:polyadenylate-binding protein-interacting protein 9-like isoform X2 [Durio zibethinus]|uniref:Polyadenylate-binding protein-interacting protein 9-like isoform X2 n=1 Tax=Durio zibethinus TaxID=66656 RepID=A0A6P5XZP6_DURZI|nr:polyadenylate-binding protein-interacting protein 9-like isoform X2 [Durio zibethinus]